MYSLFVGLTLGGIPIVWTMLKPASGTAWAGAALGFAAMAALALLQQQQVGGGGSESSMPMLFLAGIAGASAMILPGVSGGYLLLVMGQYVPILSAVDQLKEGLSSRDWSTVWSVGLEVCVPVGLGVVAGIVLVSHLIRILLKKFPKATLGFLLGLLFGAVVGLWPFQEGVKPSVGDTVKGQVMDEAALAELDPEDYPTAFFTPSPVQVGGSLGFVVLGLGLTGLVGRLGGGGDQTAPDGA
jgi:putative membrane protein